VTIKDTALIIFFIQALKNLKIIQCSRVFAEKLTVAQLVKNTPPFYETKSSLLCSKELAIGTCPDQDDPHTIFFMSFQYYPPLYAYVFQRLFSTDTYRHILSL
jgi:hypothetical protein